MTRAPRSPSRPCALGAFTLVELLVVISIIAVLMALLFPAMNGVRDQAKKTQAKNDITQIVSAVNSYYTEYSKYPINVPAGGTTTDVIYGTSATGNEDLFNTLRAIATGANANNVLNPRQIAYYSGPDAKDATNPRSGFVTKQVTVTGWGGVNIGALVDPWGDPYLVGMDGDYSTLTQVQKFLKYTDLTYSQDNGNPAVRAGVIAGSYGKDGTIGKAGNATFKGSDDVLSWQ